MLHLSLALTRPGGSEFRCTDITCPTSTCPEKMAIITLSKLPSADTEQDETQDQGDNDNGHSQEDPEIVPPPTHCWGSLRRTETEA